MPTFTNSDILDGLEQSIAKEIANLALCPGMSERILAIFAAEEPAFVHNHIQQLDIALSACGKKPNVKRAPDQFAAIVFEFDDQHDEASNTRQWSTAWGALFVTAPVTVYDGVPDVDPTESVYYGDESGACLDMKFSAKYDFSALNDEAHEYCLDHGGDHLTSNIAVKDLAYYLVYRMLHRTAVAHERQRTARNGGLLLCNHHLSSPRLVYAYTALSGASIR